MSSCDVLVIGAGPAGSAVAMGLARLGHRVVVIDAPRRYGACEGITARVVEWLRGAGFSRALDEVPAAARRSVAWNADESDRNSEHLVWRQDFDRALGADLTASGIEIHRSRLRRVLSDDQPGPCTQLVDGRLLRSRLVVDARGRAGNRGGRATRGPATLSIGQAWVGPTAATASALIAFEDGWAWLARRADGRYYTQLSVAADAPDVPSRPVLAAWLQERLAQMPRARAWVEGCEPIGAPHVRASTALLNVPLWRAERVLRVGDAAMAVDPLSGNGIFQALSSASVAPAVVNTLLRDSDNAHLALRFYEDRLRHVFERFARIGRDFYYSERRWPAHPFWRERSVWPDSEPTHGDPTTRKPLITRRPVVDEGFIREHEVVVTAEQPLGVWRVAGVAVAPLLRELPTLAQPDADVLLERAGGADSTTIRALRSFFATLRQER